MMIAALLYLGGVERAVYFNDFVILFSRVAHPLIGQLFCPVEVQSEFVEVICHEEEGVCRHIRLNQRYMENELEGVEEHPYWKQRACTNQDQEKDDPDSDHSRAG